MWDTGSVGAPYMWAWSKPNKHLMCGYTCKGLYSHHVTEFGLGQTVYVFGISVFFYLFIYFFVLFLFSHICVFQRRSYTLHSVNA